jgi:hypothetical protein
MLRLPPSLKGRFPELGGRTVVEATTSRGAARLNPRLTILDFENNLFRHLIRLATSTEFSSGYASIVPSSLSTDLAAAYLIRWQTDQGENTSEELIAFTRANDGSISPSKTLVKTLFKDKLRNGTPIPMPPHERQSLLKDVQARVEVDIGTQVTRLKHINDIVLLAACDGEAALPNVPSSPAPGTAPAPPGRRDR